MRHISTALLLALFTGCVHPDDTGNADEWQETSFTDDRGLRWLAAVSVVDDGDVVQGWAGVQNASDSALVLRDVQNCGLRNPVELRDPTGQMVDFDPFDGNQDAVDDARCEPQPIALPRGETLWLSTVTWHDVEPGEYELFVTWWSGQAAALRFGL